MNQDYNIPGNPYYSVRAPQSQLITSHGQPIPWYFQNWDGDDVDFEDSTQTETAVVFQQPDAEVRALYKGHFVSANSEATGANNGRRMARDDNGILHAVYEDGGRIWYTHILQGTPARSGGLKIHLPEFSIARPEYECLYFS